MNTKKISNNIGWDGGSFFCLHCGRAGYKSLASVKGHLAMCPGKAIGKGAVPGFQLAGQPAPASPSLAEYPNYQPSMEVASQQVQQQQEARIARLENELNHMVVSRNAPASDWLAQNKNWIILLGVVFLAAYMMMKQTGKCDAQSNAKPGNFSNLGEKIVSNFANRAVTKSVDSLFN